MASSRKRGRRWEARIRKKGYETVCETFAVKREAEEWADHLTGSSSTTSTSAASLSASIP